jgi:hypothetical protein
MPHRYHLCGLLAAAVCWTGAASAVSGKDYFLTIGGGYNPTGNQVSLEKNVLFLQSVLAEKRPDRPTHDIFFADGNDEARDVHYRDPDFEANCPPARRIMAELFGDADSMDYIYRNHEIKGVAGPAERGLLGTRFRELAQQVRPGDRLIIYATGHGGPASGPPRGGRRRGGGRAPTNPYNTTLHLWNDQAVSASEFADWLGRLPRDVPVVLVMVQCHAGGFAHTIFEQATSGMGLAPHARCGFFSQVYDRAAAGCTPDVDEADYQEYSSFFWAALAGRTRTGAAVAGVDYDGNGEVSFAEAHAYAVLASDTIDIPVRTSDALLREYSRAEGVSTGSAAAEAAGGRRGRRGRGGAAARGPAAEPAEVVRTDVQPVADLMSLSGPIARLAEIARPDVRAVLEQLPLRVGLARDSSIDDLRRRLADVEAEIENTSGERDAASRRYSRQLATAQEEVRRIWPELHSDYAPLAVALASERADEFVARVTALDSYRQCVAARQAEQQASEARLNAERMEAKLQRLLRTCEDVVLAANLPKVATPEIVARFEQLTALESGTLGGSK